MELRQALFADNDQRVSQTLDATDAAAFQALLDTIDGPLVVVSEAVLIYVEEHHVAKIFALTAERGNAEFIFDWASPIMKRNSHNHPAIKKMKSRAAFASSMKRGSDITNYDPRWRIISQSSSTMTRAGLGPFIFAWLYFLCTGGCRFYGTGHAKLKS